ncbi:hypothetical protein PCC7424_5585 (plasmid) [Gloeothece citriformis PCC 7424]|uniref:Uncharacterized protein n=1 Tax=Gloeothece citriformis (strain PCC 7424) TaxID=65393 RepID=B7KMX6_GLOC7|nr:hypothetical protein PCC7424_5585 [Gloeothece citriformis PCC 7424]
MAKTLDEMMKQLPSSRRSKIEARAKELINEQMTHSSAPRTLCCGARLHLTACVYPKLLVS